MSIYRIEWLIKPQLSTINAKNVFNYGQRMTVEPGYWKENTEYTVTCRLFFQDEPSINGTSTFTFKTAAPPKNGTVSIFPDYGYIGDTFVIAI